MATTESSFRIISRLTDGTQLSGGDSGTTESVGVWLSQQTRPNIVVSADGRWVAFTSRATNLPGDADGGGVDVYLKDTVDGSLRLVSVSATGQNSGSNATPLAISDDGRWVLFASGANNLGDFGLSPVVNASVYLKDMQTGQVLDMVPEFKPAVANSLAADGDMSRDARFVVYVSGDSNITGTPVSGSQVFLFDRSGGQTSIVSRRSDGSLLDSASDPHVSDDGQWVIFQTPTAASPLDTNTSNDLYARHTASGQLKLLSVGFDGKAAGGENAQLSPDGRYATFLSKGAVTSSTAPKDVVTGLAINLAYRVELATGVVQLVSATAAGLAADRNAFSATMSDDGRYVLFKTDAQNFDGQAGLQFQGSFPSYTRGEPSTFVKDMLTGELVSMDTYGSMRETIAVSLVLSGDASTLVFGAGKSQNGFVPPLVAAAQDVTTVADVYLGQTGLGGPVANQTLQGSSASDRLTGGAGRDSLDGGAGDDVLTGGAGSDTLSGGEGYDVASWAGSTPGVNADLRTGTVTQGSDTDTLSGIEALFGTAAADTVRGADGAPNLRGETVRGGGGNDTIDGGTGVDTAEFTGPRAGYRIERNGNTITVTDTDPSNGDDGVDTLLNVERLVFADAMVAFGTRAEDVARAAFVLWTPDIISSTWLFARGYSFYDVGYDLAFMCQVALQFHPEQGLAFAQKLVANMPGTARTVDGLMALMAAAGGGDAGRAAAVQAMALDANTTEAMAQRGVTTVGVNAALEVPGFGTLFGLLPG